MFKEKTSKKRLHISENNKDISTLDAMHNNMIKDFSIKIELKSKYLNNICTLKNIQSNIIKDINNLSINAEYNVVLYDNLWNCNIDIQEEIINIKNKIKDIDNFNEIDYYENTSDILFNYYDMIEKQSYHKITGIDFGSTRTVLDALHNINNNTNNNNNNTNNNKNIDKSSLVDEYLSITDKQHVKKINSDDTELCRNCKTQLTCLQQEAIMICNNCGYQELLLVEQNRPILKQNTKDTSHFSYKRINHFREWCNQVQGKESTDIPDEIFEKILNEIKKEKINDTKTITYNKMREILKRLRINKYYEHINYIINRINGIPTPQFSGELEEKLCNMFRDIQGPFLKYCPKDRKNFLSYSYVLYKFFQLLGLNEYLKYFPLLKSREKLYVQDQIWKKICEELNYEIIPSL